MATTATISPRQWQTAREALEQATARFVRLVETVDRPDTMVTAHWSVADTVVHLVSVAWWYATKLDPDHPPLPIPGLSAQLPTVTVDTIADVNDLILRHLTDRSPQPLLDRFQADVDKILRITADRRPDELLSWFGDARAPLAGLFGHLVNELLVHGWDIARATGRPWKMPGSEAVLFFEVFLVNVLRAGYGHLLDNDEPPRERPITVEFRSAYCADITLVLHRGVVTVAAPGTPPDVRVRFDPAALNLMLFGRVSRVRTVLAGKLALRGPRPWLLFPFLRVLRAPN
ncbi:maleylpyruvate isomerase family mycothiol-dependent enzyme [Micromonospora sp. NPDC020750]|uniref:maleylpyruvate isomerase family mycothiol-dependent enzyme n=1 Tax=unclassified Micromonospora TaxID=2617518 RepID=UPI00378E1724